MAGEAELRKVKVITVGGNSYSLCDSRVDSILNDFILIRRDIARLADPKASVKSVKETLIEVMRILRGDVTTEQQRQIAAIPEPLESINSCQETLISVMRVLTSGVSPS